MHWALYGLFGCKARVALRQATPTTYSTDGEISGYKLATVYLAPPLFFGACGLGLAAVPGPTAGLGRGALLIAVSTAGGDLFQASIIVRNGLGELWVDDIDSLGRI